MLTCLGLGQRTHAQTWYFYEDFDRFAVNADGAADLPDGFTLYNDANKPFDGIPDLSHFDKAWKIIRGLDGEGHAAAPSLFKTKDPANRWMVTPGIALTGAKTPVLYFRAKADDERARDGFILKISTTSTDSTTFKNLRSVRAVRASWTDYAVDLSEYAGQTVYIAFVQNSTYCATLSIDDIRVGEVQNDLAAACNATLVPMYMLVGSKGYRYKISAELQNWSNTAITSARLCVRQNDGTTVTQHFDGLNLAPANTTDGVSLAKQGFSLDFPTEYNQADGTVHVWFDQINGTAQTAVNALPCYIAPDGDLPYKKLMMEIFSSAMCTNCGPWNKEFHGWDQLYGGNEPDNYESFVFAKFQIDVPTVGDPLVTDETLARSNFYGVGYAPFWVLNGRQFVLSVIAGNAAANLKKVTQTFFDSLTRFRHTISPFGLKAQLTREGSTVTVNTKTFAHLPVQGKFKLYIALAEDSIHMPVAQISEENDYFHVVRKMLPDVNGTVLEVPQAGGQPFETTHTYTFGDNPKLYQGMEGLGVIAYIQNTQTKEIIQATFAKGDGRWSDNENAGRSEAAADLTVYPNPAAETATVRFQPLTPQPMTVSVRDLQGRTLMRLQTAGGLMPQTLPLQVGHLPAGTYLISVENPGGISSVKLLKK